MLSKKLLRQPTCMESVPLMLMTILALSKSTPMKKGVSPTSEWKVAYTISVESSRHTSTQTKESTRQY